MKTISLVILCLVNYACSKNSASLVEITQNQQHEDTLPIVGSENPGEITFEAQVVESYTSKKQVCGLEKNNVALLKVEKVVTYGSGFVNVPQKETELLVPFLFIDQPYKPGTKLLITGKESLCQNNTSTYITGLKHQILE